MFTAATKALCALFGLEAILAKVDTFSLACS